MDAWIAALTFLSVIFLIMGNVLSPPAAALAGTLVLVYGGVFTLFFTGDPVHNLADAKRCDTQAYARNFHAMLDRGYYLPPSQFEVGFISAAHSDEEIDGLARFRADNGLD